MKTYEISLEALYDMFFSRKRSDVVKTYQEGDTIHDPETGRMWTITESSKRMIDFKSDSGEESICFF